MNFFTFRGLLLYAREELSWFAILAMKFRTIPESRRPNRWLICPPGYASVAPNETPPVFDAGVGDLREAWRALIGRQPRVTISCDEIDRMELVQRTRLLRFADDISVAYVELGHGRSTIALFSRSRIGYSDLGTNRRRLQEWLGLLGRDLPVAKVQAAGAS